MFEEGLRALWAQGTSLFKFAARRIYGMFVDGIIAIIWRDPYY
jgi:hypothetical protein